ncbi:DUF308 domain-containing protein [Leucobacter ruminantium]|uniref:DUF308 domain-containing protein n=1 Tax=Leucobacter ruminantium TaxID=1289170 RepID=A0A939RX49_9MICO|nr:DUF308 domain-containing protein [Leucobacter ruminantium]MBO1805732.1 DUF308 domain-containing protein [Leucobacter ruminantium]
MSWEIVSGGDAPTRRFPWWIPLAVGVLVLFAGCGLLLWPFFAASWLLAVLFGSALIANGLALLVRQRSNGATVAAGIVLIAGGVLAMVFSGLTADVIVTLFGTAVILIGALWLTVGVRAGGGAAVLVPAIIVILTGVVALVWPGVALAFVAVLGGLVMLLLGSSLVWTALALRRALR